MTACRGLVPSGGLKRALISRRTAAAARCSLSHARAQGSPWMPALPTLGSYTFAPAEASSKARQLAPAHSEGGRKLRGSPRTAPLEPDL